MNLVLITYTVNGEESQDAWINANEILSIEALRKTTLIKFTNGQRMYTEEPAKELVQRIRTFT